MKNTQRAICLAVALTLGGCGLTSPMLKPNVNTPVGWNESSSAAAMTVSQEWWGSYGSAELQSLVNEALAGSPDLAIATERVRQAEAQVRIAGSSLFPQLNLGGGT